MIDYLLTSSQSASSGSEEEELEGAISTLGKTVPVWELSRIPHISRVCLLWWADQNKDILEREKIKCIIEHPSFHAVCLNTDVLWTALVGLADRENAKIPKK